jgi:NAD(P)-dependent dehydrogenase (short-subunit alcohol dehydrogenase family)
MLNPLDLTSRTILVTGASSGIGWQTAIVLSRLGARVIGCGRDRGRLEQLLAELEGSGHAVEAFDLADADEIPDWLKGVAARNGHLDGLVHSAGFVQQRPLRVTNAADVASLAAMDLIAPMMLLKAFRQKTVRGANPSAVLVSSVAALRAQPAMAAYCATKGGMVSLTRCLGRELAAEGIRVNCICAGLVRTRMYESFAASLPAERQAAVLAEHVLGLGEPEDIAHAVAFLLSCAARWITGTMLVVDGGYLL